MNIGKPCILCGEKTIPLTGICTKCGLLHHTLQYKKGKYIFRFINGKSFTLPKDGKKSMDEFCKENKNSILAILKEEEKHREDKTLSQEELAPTYLKGEMCPFTQISIGQETHIGGYGGGTYVWQHAPCIKEFCAIWDNKNKQCSIKTISQKLIPTKN